MNISQKVSEKTADQKWTDRLAAFPAGLVLVALGLSQALNYFRFALVRFVPFSFVTCKTLEIITNGLVFLVVVATLYYLYRNKKSWTQAPGKYVALLGLAWFVSLIIVYLLMKLILGHVIFELQHGLFMMLNALAILSSGMILQEKPLIRGGFIFLILALAAAFFKLSIQMLFESAAWIFAFVLPGYTFYKRS